MYSFPLIANETILAYIFGSYSLFCVCVCVFQNQESEWSHGPKIFIANK